MVYWHFLEGLASFTPLLSLRATPFWKSLSALWLKATSHTRPGFYLESGPSGRHQDWVSLHQQVFAFLSWALNQIPSHSEVADACSGWRGGFRKMVKAVGGVRRYSRQTHSRGRRSPCAPAASSGTFARSWICKSCKTGKGLRPRVACLAADGEPDLSLPEVARYSQLQVWQGPCRRPENQAFLAR